LNSDFRDRLSMFIAEGVEFLLVGAYALAVHGVARATGDINLWVRPSPDNALRDWNALAKFGAPVSVLSTADLPTPGLIYQIGVAPRRIDVITSIDGVDFDQAWASRREVTIDGIKLTVLGREDLIRNKRAAGRPKDLADLALLEESTEPDSQT
jgi:predicted nucleotidyltransferase